MSENVIFSPTKGFWNATDGFGGYAEDATSTEEPVGSKVALINVDDARVVPKDFSLTLEEEEAFQHLIDALRGQYKGKQMEEVLRNHNLLPNDCTVTYYEDSMWHADDEIVAEEELADWLYENIADTKLTELADALNANADGFFSNLYDEYIVRTIGL